MRRLIVCVGAAALLAPAALAFPNAMHPELGAKLLGKNEVPKGSPTAHGIVNLNLNYESPEPTAEVLAKFLSERLKRPVRIDLNPRRKKGT